MPPVMPWLKQVYIALIPAYPMGYMLVHGFRGDQIWTKMYVERSHFPSTDHLNELVESEMDKMGEIKNPKKLISLTDYMEPRVYGGFFLNPGAELQFPLRVSFDDVEQARRMGANLELDLGLAKNRRKIELDSQVGDELVSRMMLSDAAKRFVVQRQLQLANNGVLFCAPIFGWIAISSVGYAVMAGVSMVAGSAVGFVAAVSVSVAAFRQFLKNFDAHRTKQADEASAERGDIYAQGARDYFLAGMKFNRLMRHVLGDEGEKNIAKNGDITTEPITYSDRLKNVESFLRRKKTEEKAVSSTKSKYAIS